MTLTTYLQFSLSANRIHSTFLFTEHDNGDYVKLTGHYTIHLIEFDFSKSTSCVINNKRFDIFNKSKIDFN